MPDIKSELIDRAKESAKVLGSVYYDIFIKTKKAIDEGKTTELMPDDIRWFYDQGPLEEIGALTAFFSVQQYMISVLREFMTVEEVQSKYEDVAPILKEVKIGISESSGLDVDVLIIPYIKKLGIAEFIKFHRIATEFGETLSTRAERLGRMLDEIKSSTIH